MAKLRSRRTDSNRLRRHFEDNAERMKDIGIASALQFYSLREPLADSRHPRERVALLGDMRSIVKAEAVTSGR